MDIIVPTSDFCAKELFAHETVLKYFISDVTKKAKTGDCGCDGRTQ